MATVVLVHGAWHGGWCWRRVAPPLRAAGHEVLTPTLTGLGERAHLARASVDLETHVQDVLAVLEYEGVVDAVLVGHSYGGVVGTLVADRAAGRLARLVYLDAPLPRDGQRGLDLLAPAAAADFQARAQAGDGWRIAPNTPAELGLVTAEDVAWAAPRLTPQPLATFTQPARLTGAGERVPRAYIFCAPARPGSRLPEFAAPARAAGWVYHEVASGHDAMISAPNAVVAALLDIIQHES